LFNFHGRLRITEVSGWGKRTPILHPSVAGVDVTEAGYDDAYLRALQQVDVLTFGTRDESKMLMRRMVEQYSRLKYSPYRLLVRAVVLWAIAARSESHTADAVTGYNAAQLAQPMRLSDGGGFSAIARTQASTPGDVIYLRCETASDLELVEVARALSAVNCPVSTNMTIRQLWPKMSAPQVVYTSAVPAGMGTASFTSTTVEEFLYKFCGQFDCFDLLELAVVQVQQYLCRPNGAGVLGGASDITIGMPTSDLRIGAIGPLLAGVSAEGMRTTRYTLPQWAEFAYGAAARGCFVTAAYYEGLLQFDQTHPVAYTYSSYTMRGRVRALTDIRASRAMIEKYVAPILEPAGWDCWPTELRDVAPTNYTRFERRLFDGSRVPWWTNVIGHLTEGGAALLQDWARPAHIRDHVIPGDWYTYAMLQGATREQVTSAVRWLGAKVSYVMANTATTAVALSLPRPSVSRFMAVLKSEIVLSGRQRATACIQFPKTANGGAVFLRSIAQCTATVIKTNVADEELPAMAICIEGLAGGLQPGPAANEVDLTGAGDDDGSVLGDDVSPDRVREGPEQPADNIDWEEITGVLQQLGINTTASVFPAALSMGRERSNGPYLAAMQLERLSPSVLDKQPSDRRIAVARAVLMATTRLSPHVPEGSLAFGALQGRAMRIVMDSVAARHTAPDMEGQQQLDEAASAALEAGLAESRGVPAAHDDPDGTSESLQDFGVAPLSRGSGAEQAAVSNVPHPSRMATIGFLPPEPSAALSESQPTQGPVVQPPSE